MVVPSADVAFSSWLMSDSSVCAARGSDLHSHVDQGTMFSTLRISKSTAASRAFAGEDLAPIVLGHRLHVLHDGLREGRPCRVLLDRHDSGHDLLGVHLDEVPRLWAVDAHEQLTRGTDVVDVADAAGDEDRDRPERAEARHVEVATEDGADVAALDDATQPVD